MDNEINSPMSYVKIVEPPTPVIKKKVGDHVELTCEANGSPPPVIQWYRRNQRLTEVSFENKYLKYACIYMEFLTSISWL